MRFHVCLTVVLLASAALLVLPMCGGDSDSGGGCDPACAEGSTCVDGTCVEEGCNNSDQDGCAQTHSTCVSGCDPLAADYEACVAGCDDDLCTCLTNAGCTCETPACDPACTGGQECVSGACIDPPAACEPACAADEECVDGACVAPPEGCEPDCDAGWSCVDGVCIEDDVPPACDPECDEGELCVDGECVETTECDPVDEADCGVDYADCVNDCDPPDADYATCIADCDEELCDCLTMSGCDCEVD